MKGFDEIELPVGVKWKENPPTIFELQSRIETLECAIREFLRADEKNTRIFYNEAKSKLRELVGD